MITGTIDARRSMKNIFVMYYKEIAAAIGIMISSFVIYWLKNRSKGQSQSGIVSAEAHNSLSPSTSQHGSTNFQRYPPDTASHEKSLEDLKVQTHILFIDDEKFKVVDILKQQGWINTNRVRDVKSLDEQAVHNAHIIFVDIVGVGKTLFPSDQGLGLSLALKQKHPKKKIVIYSGETDGNRFHEALRRADDKLAKDADPYEFQVVTERLARLLEI